MRTGSSGFWPVQSCSISDYQLFMFLIHDVASMNDMYEVLLFPGILLVFYPSVFGIQNDQDARTIEILFGIPNYRYKVWLVRIVLIFAIAFLIMLVFTFLSSLLIVKFQILNMTAQVMYPVIFLGTNGIHAFHCSKKRKWHSCCYDHLWVILFDTQRRARKSQWNVFLNPYEASIRCQ